MRKSRNDEEMNEWVKQKEWNEWENECGHEWINVLKKWLNEEINEWKKRGNAWMNEEIYELIRQLLNEWGNEWMNKWMNEKMNEWKKCLWAACQTVLSVEVRPKGEELMINSNTSFCRRQIYIDLKIKLTYYGLSIFTIVYLLDIIYIQFFFLVYK